MTELEQAKAQVSQAREKIKQVKEQLKLQREQAKKTKEKLDLARSKLPVWNSARALRQGSLIGLEGREKRRKMKKIEESYKAQEEKVKKFEEGLDEYEKTKLAPVEKQVEAQAREIADYEDTQNAIKIAERMYDNKIPWAFTEGKVRKYLRKMYKMHNLQKEAFLKKVEKFQIENPSEKLQIDWKNLKITGVQSGALGKTLSLKEYNSEINKLKKSSSISSTNPIILNVPKSNVLINSTNLKKNGGLNLNVSSLSNGSNNRNYSRMDFITSIGNSISNFASDFYKGAKTNYEKEIYNPQTGNFELISANPQLAKGTTNVLSARLPTKEEADKLNILNNFAITTNLDNLNRDIRNLNNLNLERDRLTNQYNELIKGKIDSNGFFNGTSREYKELQNISNKIKLDEQKIKSMDSTKKFSFFGYKSDVPIKRLSNPFSFINAQTETIGRAVGQVASSLGKKGGYFSIPEHNVTVYTPQFGTIQTDVLTGNPITGYSQVTIPKAEFGTPEQFRKRTETLFSTGKYFVPLVGGGLFASEVGEELSKVNYNPLKFIKEKPFESALIGGTLLGLGALKGVRYLSQEARMARAINKLNKAEPELFFGLEKGEEGTSTLLVGARRKMGRLKSDTLTKFDVLRIGDKTYQIQKGKGVQKVSKEMKFFSDYKPIKQIEFTLTGEAQKVPVKIIKEGELSNLIRNIKEPTKGFFSEVQILTKGENPELLKSFGIGLQETEGEITKSLLFPAKKAVKLKEGEIKIIDLSTGEEKIVNMFGKPKVRVPTKNLESLGVIKHIESKGSGMVNSGKTKLNIITETKNLESLGGVVGLQTENKLLSSQKVSKNVKFFPKFKGEKTITIQEQNQISIQSKPVLLERQKNNQRVVPKSESVLSFKREIVFDTSLKPKQEFKLLTKQEIKPIQKTTSLESQKPMAKQILKYLSSQKSKQKTAQEGVITTRTTTTTRTPKTPKIKMNTTPKTTYKDILSKAGIGRFKVFVRKKGKDVLVGESKSKEEAKKKLTKLLKKELRASGFVTTRGKKVKIGDLGEGFRISKVDPFRVVEKKEKRIKRKEKSREAREIQFFRKTKRKGWF